MAQRSSRAQQSASVRTNEYFVPRDGIDREVITADICRYLGNDALVRPGNYENPTTRQVQQGYFITAYRNLTTAMIADLKADSERWDSERRQQQNASRGGSVNGISVRDPDGIVRNSNTPIVEYRASTTHQSRQYYGPTEAPAGGAGGYAQPSTPQVYDNGAQYQGQSYGQPAAAYTAPTSGYSQAGVYSTAGYAQPTGYAPQVPDSNYYVAGASMEVDRERRSGPAPSGTAQPRTVQYAASNSSYQGQPDSRAGYYAQPGPAASTQYAAPQPSDPFYGRGAYLYAIPFSALHSY
ncbi:transcription factor RfeG [Phlyctema vagabunda]|uniref:Transcription factor RfeG n=1 Tax=Phlyctema vagabunda TaxID=108571 RepID=A0ABR4P6E3_9HELO